MGSGIGERAPLAEFLNWLLEVAPQRKCARRARGFRKRMGWHWQLASRIEPGEVHGA